MMPAPLRTLSALVTEAWQSGLCFADAHLDVHTQGGDLLKPFCDPAHQGTSWRLNIESPGPDKGGQLVVVDSLAREKSRRGLTVFVATINENRREQRLLVEVYGERYYNIKLPQHRTRPCALPYLPKELTYSSGQHAWWGIELFRAITLLTAGCPDRLKVSSHYADALAVVATAEALCLALHGSGFVHAHFPHSTGYCKLRDETRQAQRTLLHTLEQRLGQDIASGETDFAHTVRNAPRAPESGLCRDFVRAVYAAPAHHRQQCRTARRLALAKAHWARSTAAKLCTRTGCAPHDPVISEITSLLRTGGDELSLASRLAIGPRLLREACGDAANVVIAQSSTMRDQRAHLPHLSLCAIPNAIDTAVFRPLNVPQNDVRRRLEHLSRLPEGWLAGAHPLIVGGGRFDPRKGLIELTQAAAWVCRFFPGTRLTLFGNHSHPQGQSDTESEILKTIEDLVGRHPILAGRVALVGKQSQRVLAHLFYAADLCVFPNREEPDGLVVKEALATTSGQQVVIATTTTSAALQMNALSGQTVCHLAPPGDVAALADRMIACLHDFQRCAQASRLGGRHVHQHLGQPAYALQVIEAINRVAAHPASPRKTRAIHRLAAAAGLGTLLARHPVRIARLVALPCR